MAPMIVGAMEARAADPTYGKIHYTRPSIGSMLTFCSTLDSADRFDSSDITNSADQSGNDYIYVYDVSNVTLTDDAEMSVDVQGGGYAIWVTNNDIATLDIYGEGHLHPQRPRVRGALNHKL